MLNMYSTLFFVFVLTGTSFSYAQSSDTPELFVESSVSLSQSITQNPHYSTLTEKSLRVSPLFQTNFEAFESDLIRLNVFGDSILVEKQHIRYFDDSPYSFVYTGKVSDRNDSISFVVMESQIRAGDIDIDSVSYDIVSLSDSFVLVEYDQNKIVDYEDELIPITTEFLEEPVSLSFPQQVHSNYIPEIEILIGYTPAALVDDPNLLGNIRDYLTEVKESYETVLGKVTN
jgi:hypothetical protein